MEPPSRARQQQMLDTPTRSYPPPSGLEGLVGFLAASIFSVVYVAAPLYTFGAPLCLLRSPKWWGSWAAVAPIGISLLVPSHWSILIGKRLLPTWPFQQILKYFRYEEYCEFTDKELMEQHDAGRRFIMSVHPHGVFSFVGVCVICSSIAAADGAGGRILTETPTAAASVITTFPFLKHVLTVFGVVDAGQASLAKRLARKCGSVCLYVGGMAELFRSSPKRETVFLKNRKGFIKLALRTGADVVPVYFFGNTTVLSVLKKGPLASLSRKLGVSITFFWGRFGLPLPKQVRLTHVRGRPLGLPHIPNPTQDDIDKWHETYCVRLVELFDRYKGTNPDYKHKDLILE